MSVAPVPGAMLGADANCHGTTIAVLGLMKIAQLMTRDVKMCRDSDTLDVAVRLMWEFDIGSVVVVNDLGQAIGVVTDRDACMAAYLQAQPLHAISCKTAMSNHVVTCRPSDPDSNIAALMASHKIRRIPVVDEQMQPIGMVSLNDLALAMAKAVPPHDVAGTLAAISEHRAAAVA